jgi:predicted phosphoribosyltransferase
MESRPAFANRADAGRRLATRLQRYANNPRALVLALPRGGVPVAFEIAEALHLPLDVLLVRKLGVPGHEELAMGAVTSRLAFLDHRIVEHLDISQSQIEDTIRRERTELARREHAYRDDRPPPEVEGRIVLCVDDGLATGASMRAAVAALREGHPARIVVAVPVAAGEIAADMREVADDVVVDLLPERFRAVSPWYADFSQTSDSEVRDLLRRAGNGEHRT